jgi:hypothetical protein
MEIHAKYKIPVFWDDEFKKLNYVNEEFNDPVSIQKWKAMGYAEKFTGEMCDMRSSQPPWNDQFVNVFKEVGWKDIGTSYYRMTTGTVLPTHSDLYVRYVDLYNLHGKEHTIRRAIVFLEDWMPGHYSEIAGIGMSYWSAGTVVEWGYDTPHAAANIGIEPRYTLQITGHI